MIEAVLTLELGEQPPGPRTRHDGLNGIDVDFTYDLATVPFALEVTSIRSPVALAQDSRLQELEEDLDVVAKAEELGHWMFAVWLGAKVKNLERPLLRLIRGQSALTAAAGGILEPDKARRSAPDATARAEAAELARLGLVSALRVDRSGGSHKVEVFPPVSDETSTRGFTVDLEQVIRDNQAKLAAARPRATHLAVVVTDSRLSPRPQDSPAPSLADECLEECLGHAPTWTVSVAAVFPARRTWAGIDSHHARLSSPLARSPRSPTQVVGPRR